MSTYRTDGWKNLTVKVNTAQTRTSANKLCVIALGYGKSLSVHCIGTQQVLSKYCVESYRHFSNQRIRFSFCPLLYVLQHNRKLCCVSTLRLRFRSSTVPNVKYKGMSWTSNYSFWIPDSLQSVMLYSYPLIWHVATLTF